LEPVKVVIFIIAFLALFLFGRMLSSRAEVHANHLPVPDPEHNNPQCNVYVMPAAVGTRLAENLSDPGSPSKSKHALTGAEIPFPFAAPPVKRDDKGRFNRPYYLNYYFRQIDLVEGPPDRTSFCDHLTIVYQYPETSGIWEIEYLVATPTGLRDYMNRSDFDSLYLDHYTVIVREWNLATILRTLMEEQMRALEANAEDSDDKEEKGPTPLV
jgi:hypothetical protein